MPEISQNSPLIFINPGANTNLNNFSAKLNPDAIIPIITTKVNISSMAGTGPVPPDNIFAGDFKPVWSDKIKKTISANFNQGLKFYKTTPEELSSILKANNLSLMAINSTNIQDPAFAGEVKKIQEELNARFNNSENKELGIAHSLPANGVFNKNTISLLLALRDSYRGAPVSISVNPIKQATKDGCFRTAEAMYFNFLHQKDGGPDTYTEADINERLSNKDRRKSDIMAGITGENDRGRVSFPRSKGLNMLNNIDRQLEQNPPVPVLVGISRKKQEKGKTYNEGYTDHFVLITGRGYDENGLYYSFNDPAQGGRDRKFRFDSASGKLSGKGDMKGPYDVTMVSAYENNPAAIDLYKRIGKPVYSPGDNLPELKDIQIELNYLGFKLNKADGNYSDKTVHAVREFQGVRNLPDTGIIDSYTRAAIERDFRVFQQMNPETVIFKTGDKSVKLAELQKQLNNAGFSITQATGQFGPATFNAVSNFQKANNLPVSGQIDNRTWLKIEEM
jgi:peptidoglycan hydrolase-like protein with peptidoglycan-binding domain